MKDIYDRYLNLVIKENLNSCNESSKLTCKRENTFHDEYNSPDVDGREGNSENKKMKLEEIDINEHFDLLFSSEQNDLCDKIKQETIQFMANC